MSRVRRYLGVIVIAAHGVVHLLGTAVYLELVEVADFAYKTTLFGGVIDVGDVGMRVFGGLWAAAAVGFVAAAGALLTDWEQWRRLLVGVALFSLVLTAVDYTVAYAGVVVNLSILAAMALSLRMQPHDQVGTAE